MSKKSCLKQDSLNSKTVNFALLKRTWKRTNKFLSTKLSYKGSQNTLQITLKLPKHLLNTRIKTKAGNTCLEQDLAFQTFHHPKSNHWPLRSPLLFSLLLSSIRLENAFSSFDWGTSGYFGQQSFSLFKFPREPSKLLLPSLFSLKSLQQPNGQ